MEKIAYYLPQFHEHKNNQFGGTNSQTGSQLRLEAIV